MPKTILIIAIIFFAGCSNVGQKNIEGNNNNNLTEVNKPTVINNQNNMEYVKQYSQAIITTNLGKIKIKFYNNDSPATVNNFLKLAAEKFYDGTKFHRIIKGFMIQGGDPNSKTSDTSTWGRGGPGYQFADELTGKEKYLQGTVAMANAGPNTNGSQFFIVTANPGYPLPPQYTVFGQVTSGMDVALKIENVKTTTNDRPVEDAVIQSMEVVK